MIPITPDTVTAQRRRTPTAVRVTVLCATIALAVGVCAPSAWASGSSFFSNVGVGSLTTARWTAAAAPLPDGRVLIAGGARGATSFASAELFDPSTNTFTALASPMTSSALPEIAAPLIDGRVLIAGGYDGTKVLSSAELYDPATGTFAPTGSLTAPRDDAAAAPLPDGRVLITGGFDGTKVLSSAEVYDPASGSFTTLAAHPPQSPRGAGGGAAARWSRARRRRRRRLQRAVKRRGVRAGDRRVRRPSGQPEAPRDNAVAAPLADGRVLIAGGGGSGFVALSSAELFDPVSGTFTALGAQMTGARTAAVAAPLPDGRVLIAGGFNGVVSLSSAETYVPAPEAAAAGGDFGAQTVGQPSAVQSLMVSNVGAQSLSIAGASLSGAAAGDFALTSDGCAGRRLAFEQSCTISVRFIPSVGGARPAALTLATASRRRLRSRSWVSVSQSTAGRRGRRVRAARRGRGAPRGRAGRRARSGSLPDAGARDDARPRPRERAPSRTSAARRG